MASESNQTNVMLTGQTGYMRKEGSMINLGTIIIEDTNSEYTYTEGFIDENSIIKGTLIEDTTDYIDCETSMKEFLGDIYTETEEEYSIMTNANLVSNMLQEPCNKMQTLVNSI